jgi:hypothetical protein
MCRQLRESPQGAADIPLLGLIVIVGMDLAIRYCAEPRSAWRFVVPIRGGSILFVPVWLYFAFFLLFGLGMTVVHAFEVFDK